MLARSLLEHPKVLFATILIIFPSIPMMAATFAFPDTLYVNAISFSLILLAGRRLLILPPVVAMLLGVATIKTFSVVILLFTVFSMVFYTSQGALATYSLFLNSCFSSSSTTHYGSLYRLRVFSVSLSGKMALKSTGSSRRGEPMF
jgi:hypothetical protein